MKKLLSIILVLISTNIFSQTTRHYESDYFIQFRISADESIDGGSVEDIIKTKTIIIHNTLNSTVEIKYAEQNETIFLFTNVKYSQKFTSDNETYSSYTAFKNGDPYFISFSNNIIKIDNRKKFKGLAFHLKK